MRWNWMVAGLLCAWVASAAAVAQHETEGIAYVPGRPLTMWVPDPDAVQWEGRQDRPGYRYRGMAPIQQRFYDYIQSKRAAGTPLTWADRLMIAQLQAIRRWPEAPVPDEFWREYMRELRRRETSDLSFADTTMLAQLISRGYFPSDAHSAEDVDAISQFLSYSANGPRTPRNWFERSFGRVNDWTNHLLASCGVDIRESAGASGAGVFPDTHYNGMQIRYSLTGASLDAPTESFGSTASRGYRGTMEPGSHLTFRGSVSLDAGLSGTAKISLSAGAEHEEASFVLKPPGGGKAHVESFSLSMQVPPDAERGRFRAVMTMHSPYGSRQVMVVGNLAISEAEREARRAEEDARWREEVERALRALGYENTAEGIALAEMRAALAVGDEAFKAWSEAQFRAYDSQPDPEATGFEELRAALDAGGEAWEAYTQTQQQPREGGADGAAPPAHGEDFGGLQVGTGAEGGNLEGARDRFAPLPALSTVWRFEELPDGTACEVVWTRDGAELTRSSREVGGSGWVSFQIRGGGRGNLPPGEYVVTLSVGGQAVGQKTFIVTD